MMSLSRKTKRTILAGSLLVVGVLAIALLVWIIYLDRIITAQFEGRRWTLPAQVFAEPLELYVGQSFGAQTLEQELKRLGYRSVDKAEQPGSYSRRGARVELVNRRFQFWDALQEPQLLSIVTRGNSIESMRNGRGEEVPIFRLDPLLIGSIFPIHGEDRVVVTPDQVSPLLPAALKVVEDRKFDSHHGVDYGAIARAAWVNLRAGQIEQGGSTLTQQLVKSYFLDNRRTLGRKVEEAMMAWLLEVHFEKQDLMNSYINEIYLGQDGNRAVHGFGLGSQFYFGKPLAELQLHEVALLVAIVRGPVLLRSSPAPGAGACTTRSRAQADGAVQGRRRKGCAGSGEEAARRRQCVDAGRRLLPGISRSRASHATPRLSRGRPDRSGTQDLLHAEPCWCRARQRRR